MRKKRYKPESREPAVGARRQKAYCTLASERSFRKPVYLCRKSRENGSQPLQRGAIVFIGCGEWLCEMYGKKSGTARIIVNIIIDEVPVSLLSRDRAFILI